MRGGDTADAAPPAAVSATAADVLRSMTGFASVSGRTLTRGWVWEMRGVNGRGLDLRVNLPEECEFLDSVVRKEVAGRCVRGRIAVTLRARREEGESEVDRAGMEAAFASAKRVQEMAAAAGIALARDTPTAMISLARQLSGASESESELAEWRAALETQVSGLVAAFDSARQSEGNALRDVLAGHVDRISELRKDAARLAERGVELQTEKVKRGLQAILAKRDDFDEGRIAMEVALLAAKSDVTEELDRLGAHADAARGLLAAGGPVGRRLDFLSQELNREANTLCSKAATAELAGIGLELKVAVDQLREQVQNVE